MYTLCLLTTKGGVDFHVQQLKTSALKARGLVAAGFLEMRGLQAVWGMCQAV